MLRLYSTTLLLRAIASVDTKLCKIEKGARFIHFDNNKKNTHISECKIVHLCTIAIVIVHICTVGVSMFDPTHEHDTNPTRVFSG